MCNLSKKSAFIGAFDSEKYWRDNNLANLPAMKDNTANNIVMTMDELQFVFCQQNDLILTRYAMNPVHINYLNNIGFCFLNNKTDIVNRHDFKMYNDLSIFEIIFNNKDYNIFSKNLTNYELSPFADIPFADKIAEKFNFKYNYSPINIVKKVNSKVYSTELKELLNMKYNGTIVKSSKELDYVATKYLKRTPILIKDEFGVSGKGNLKVDSQQILNRIISYLKKQESKGKQVRFVIEPFLKKVYDFSCQLFISNTGQVEILSIQQIVNNGFAYQGSISADDMLLRILDKNNYHKTMEEVSNILFSNGYFGHVCIDSMILENGEIIPIVEINARKSMSLIKHYLDKYLNKLGLKGNFIYITLAYNEHRNFEDIINCLDKEGLLFKLNKTNGVIPLTANSLLINSEVNLSNSIDKTYKGRLYYCAVSQQIESAVNLSVKIKELMRSIDFKVQK